MNQKTAVANRRYAKMRELYFADNPTCEYCGQAQVEEFDHVMRGRTAASHSPTHSPA